MTLTWPLANIQRLPGRLYYIDCKFSIIIYRFVLLVSVNNLLSKRGLVRFVCAKFCICRLGWSRLRVYLLKIEATRPENNEKKKINKIRCVIIFYIGIVSVLEIYT